MSSVYCSKRRSSYNVAVIAEDEAWHQATRIKGSLLKFAHTLRKRSVSLWHKWRALSASEVNWICMSRCHVSGVNATTAAARSRIHISFFTSANTATVGRWRERIMNLRFIISFYSFYFPSSLSSTVCRSVKQLQLQFDAHWNEKNNLVMTLTL